MDWQPIESAPKDGTWVLLADRKEVAMGHWIGGSDPWRDYADIGCAGMYGWKPTHWQPLPEPPA